MTRAQRSLFPVGKESQTPRIEIFSGPDSNGRYGYLILWDDPHPHFCLTCGARSDAGCGCYDLTHERGQVYQAPLPEWAKETDGKQPNENPIA